jgi:predicted component of type VI protein secretion system
MRILGVSMVRNEADLIEAFVRHHCALLDHLVVVDHDSSDQTPHILRALQAEGLPLTVGTTQALANQQAAVLTRAIRDAARRFDPRLVFALDADEFIRADRPRLEAALREVPGDGVAALRWLTHVPAETGTAHPLARLRLRAPLDADRYVKVAVGGRFAAREGWTLAPGNHAAFETANGRLVPVRTPLLDGLRLAHLPFRSVEQLVVKIVQGWLGTRLQEGRGPSSTVINAHWRRLFDHYVSGGSFAAADLRRIALTTYLDPDRTEALLGQLVDDPLPLSELRYTPSAPPDATRAVAQWAHRLVEQVVATAPAAAAAQIRSSA